MRERANKCWLCVMCLRPMRGGGEEEVGGDQWGDCVIAILPNAILLYHVCSLRLHVCVASPCQTCAFRMCLCVPTVFCNAYFEWPTFRRAYVNKIVPARHIWSPAGARFAAHVRTCFTRPLRVFCASMCACFAFFCECTTHSYIKEKRERRWGRGEKNNQSGSSLGPVTKVILRFYQWAEVPVSMETLMNEKGPSNPGDGVNKELPHRPNSVTGDAV